MAIGVYLIEDEDWIRKGIKRMIRWEEHGVALVGEGDDGKTALREILQLKPDIVLSDIRIPLMDGLSVVQAAREQLPRMKVIFISGYREFDYARQAIQLGAEEYILKPIEPDELNEVMARVVRAVRAENAESGSRVLDILEDRLPPGAAPEAPAPGAAHAHCVAVMHITESEADLPVLAAIEAALEKAAGPGLRADAFKKGRHEYGVLFTGARRETAGQARRCLEQMPALLPAPLSAHVWTMGRQVEDQRDIPISYNTAKEAYLYRRAGAQCQVLAWSGEEARGFALPDQAYLDEIRMAVELGDGERAGAALEQAIAALDGGENARGGVPNAAKSGVPNAGAGVPVKHLLEAVFTICFDILRMMHRKGLSTEGYYERCMQLWSDPLRSRNFGDIVDFARHFLRDVAAEFARARAKNICAVIEQVRRYLDEHHRENVSLQRVAQSVYLNPTYLSAMFRKLTGTTFSDYLLTKKIDTAAQILRDTRLTVAETALMVGYENTRHFSRIFRKYKGCTPSEYRLAQGAQAGDHEA